ncbi:MAG: hypothetical protein O7A66_06850, partial [Alphaproteobacteria bacterium]|nr:hypothetical protein [Alphaproteobacteria bacterium]
EELFRQVFDNVAHKEGLELSEDIYQQVLDDIRANGEPLAYFHPQFIVSQVLSSCKFEGITPQFTPEIVHDAMLNLFVRSESTQPDFMKRAKAEVEQARPMRDTA